MLRLIFVLLVSLSLVACGKNPVAVDNGTFKLADGGKAVVKNNQVTVYNAQGQMSQQSTFTSPTFLEARGFIVDIQQDLKSKSYTDFLQGDIAYPLRVNHKGKTTVYNNSEQLQPDFNKVFTKPILAAIIKQDPFELFANFQGVMIGGGQVWFNKKGIFVVNQ